MNCMFCGCPLHERCVEEHKFKCERSYHRQVRPAHKHKTVTSAIFCNEDQPCRWVSFCRCGEPQPDPMLKLLDDEGNIQP